MVRTKLDNWRFDYWLDLSPWSGGCLELGPRYWEGEPTIDTTGLDRIEVCYQNWNGFQTAVQRTMVIDGNLWTLSPTRVQSNDISTLDRTEVIDLT